MIELYHGSNVDIDSIDLSRSMCGKDFGCGFYLNPDRQQAMEMAIRTSQRMMEGNPTINTFLFDEHLLEEESILSVKVFERYIL